MFENLPKQKYSTIVIDPPLPISMAGKRNVNRHLRPDAQQAQVCVLPEPVREPLGQVVGEVHRFPLPLDRATCGAFSESGRCQPACHLQ